jgi:SAM-dependent methyltransferase
MSRWYDEAYYTGGDALVYQDYLASAASRRQGFRARLQELQRVCKTPGRLIEIGAAYGFFLDVAREQGWETFGVELSPVSSEYARSQLALNVATGDLSSVPVRGNYDLAVGWDVIEHLHDPIGTLHRLNQHLRFGAILALSTGNAACLGVPLYGLRWHLFAPPWHLYYFTPKSLGAMLSESGFRVLSVRYSGNPFYNHPAHSLRDRILVRSFCNSFTNGLVTRMACVLKQGLAFTVYACKVRGVADRTVAKRE